MKKRINSKRKGSTAELELAKILKKRFCLPFERVGVSSGARPKQVKLDDKSKETFTGDLTVPEGFRFSVECKAVNKEVDLLAPSALLDKFLTQAEEDAVSIGKQPLLCWKRNRKGWIAAVYITAFYRNAVPVHCVAYGKWFICKLETLLEQTDEFWFETED